MSETTADLLGIGDGFRVWAVGGTTAVTSLLRPLPEGVEVFDHDADDLDATVLLADDLDVLTDQLDTAQVGAAINHAAGEVAGPVLLGAALVLLGFDLAAWRAHAVGGPVLGWRYYGPIAGRVVAVAGARHAGSMTRASHR